MPLAQIDAYGKGAWLGFAVLAFWAAWPLGLAVVAFCMASGRVRGWREEARPAPGRWSNLRGEAGGQLGWSRRAAPHSGGDDAFGAYRMAKLSELEAEEKEFAAFLDRLRLARDKQEFDWFMAEQRRALPEQLAAERCGS